MGIVYVVHCIDTEGPLYETPLVPFEQLKRVFGIEIEPTRENLIKLQNGMISLNGKEEEVKNLLDSHKLSTKGDWKEIEAALKIITGSDYRNILPDSNGNGWKYSWFCMDHVGFTGNNPRRRDAGHHKVFDRYMEMVKQQNLGDIVQFHHHPVSLSGNYNDSGTAFWGSSNLNDILTRKIIDRGWFPVAFRPGFHTERPDSHWFLEQWIPFDYGNQSYEQTITGQLDMDDGRFGDWRHAPLEWKPYHPDYADYQAKGNCRRWITRCLNMHARMREINLQEVEKAFKSAQNEDVILAFTDHDYKDMLFEIEKVRNMIKTVSEKYPDVRFEYSDAVSAMRKCLKLSPQKLDMKAEIVKKENCYKLIVNTENGIFGQQPYLAIKSKKGNYFWDNFDFTEKNVWSYTFDNNTLEINHIETIGVAANNEYGDTKVIRIQI
jgi:hypothetical protein